MQKSRRLRHLPEIVRLFVTSLALLICLMMIGAAGRAGFSRLLSDQALAHNDLRSANEAIRLEPNDPEAYYVRGVVQAASGNFVEAIWDFQEAVHLRPHDSFAWLQLGKTLQARGELAAAISAFSEAVRVAPYYAEPRWHLGNSLLEKGRPDEGLHQLKLAANSNPSLLQNVIEIAWKTCNGQASQVLATLDPETDPARSKLASFFIQENQMKEALSLLRSAGRSIDYDRHVLTVQLTEKNRFRDAADVFNTGGGQVAEGRINEADFEMSESSSAPSFGWKFMSEPGSTRIGVEAGNGVQGSRCLTLIFNGFANPDAEFVSQLVLLQPHVRYRLNFSSRSQDLESSALPTVAVIEAGSNARLLGQSSPISGGTADWSSQQFEFETTAVTQAAYIVVRRQNCPREVCPIFGRASFDAFSLTKM